MNQGTPIHGVGIEAHYLLGGVPTNLSDAMQSYISLGVEVAITELDIRMELPVTTAKLAQQAVDYAAVTKACVQTDGCVGLTVWDFTDKYRLSILILY
jgi:endo-1,4-beta-xylanase